MANRIVQRFSDLRAQGAKGFVVYIGAGDPDLATTCELAWALEQAGVDVLELGVPFSDPLADGVVNQLAAQRGLEAGTTPAKVLAAVGEIRRRSEMPIVLYIYFNLVHRYGLQAFLADAARAGVDGLLVLDLPPEEAGEYDRLMREQDLCAIYLVAPTTTEDRLRRVVSCGTGFIYYVSREGVTGMQSSVADRIEPMTALIRRYTKLPVAIGFGISTPEQVRQVVPFGDAVVVGSAVVNQIARTRGQAGAVATVAGFVRTLVQAAKEP